VLDEQEWMIPGRTVVIQARDPLDELDEKF
jgi:hypothetical protein